MTARIALLILGGFALAVYAADTPVSKPAKLQITATCGRSWPRTASPATGRTAPPARPTCGSTDRDDAIEGGAIVPGKPDESELIARILLPDDDEDLMPPAKIAQEADAAQKETLKRWIAEGAEYQPHWSFIPPKQPAVPDRRRREARGSATRSMRFVLAELEDSAASTPAPEADRRTLARRLALDLTGLPPEPDGRRSVRQRQVAGLRTRSTSTSCWRRRTGASTAAGTGSTPPATPTRTASTSTTTARCGRTATGSSTRSTRTMPFDQFTIEQLAGDLLPNADARPADRHRLQPLQHHDQRRRRDRRGVPRALHPRPHRDGDAGVDGPDRRLRGLPRPQVRPDQRRRSSTRWRRSSTTRRRARWTATSRTRRRSSPCRGRRTGRGWKQLAEELADGQEPSRRPARRRAQGRRSTSG